MFASLFSTAPPVDPNAPNFHPVSSAFEPSQLFGELEPKDIEWACLGGFTVETQTFYSFFEDGTSIMCQVIHSAVGVWYPTIQFTCKIYNPNTKERTWKSVNVSNFVTPPPGLDKRSSKADEFTITYKSNPGSDAPEAYTIRANLADDLQINLDISRPALIPGFKTGKGPKGGYSYFGTDAENPEGHVVHRFWPRTTVSGMLIVKGQALPVKGFGTFIHAIQGMRPNLVAARWNFACFQSNDHDGVSGIQMDFTTIDAYGKKGSGSGFVTASVGAVVVGGKLVSVTAETLWPGETEAEHPGVVSKAIHSKKEKDPETGYEAPTEIVFQWEGPSIDPAAAGSVTASVQADLGTPDNYKGLVEKVDVLAEIPYVIKTMVNYVAGTKPFIYQWQNPATMTITGPDALVQGLSEGLQAEGILYNEATFIS
ncbi:hypothetical protein EUX98_g979 [Antrodiella citrinella]|uniref:Svf1-like C-terminal domain-containing protein n=1 Tax=Antrodiella citrinella TaxID=2447956 RepID=A0A4S4N2M7_9APHY|nr:hypothetical protein EUX98_g979 [Antrodiella citrinella]